MIQQVLRQILQEKAVLTGWEAPTECLMAWPVALLTREKQGNPSSSLTLVLNFSSLYHRCKKFKARQCQIYPQMKWRKKKRETNPFHKYRKDTKKMVQWLVWQEFHKYTHPIHKGTDKITRERTIMSQQAMYITKNLIFITDVALGY